MKLLTGGSRAAASRVSTFGTLFRLAIFISFAIIATGQDHAAGTAKPVTMMTGLGDLHHPVSTKNPQAQEFFDQGLRLIYAFNHAEAARSFQKAVDLSGNASDAERGYILALAKRFPADPKSDRRKAAEEYRDAMREVVKNNPDDLDAATLFAESGMNLHPWGLWHRDGTPEAGR